MDVRLLEQIVRLMAANDLNTVDVRDGDRRGVLVEYDSTARIFTQPADKRTEDYVTGRFG